MQNINKTKYTVRDLLQSKNITGLSLISGGRNIDAEIKDTNIIDNPDYFDWLNEGDFLLTTGYYFKDSEKEQLNTVKKLAEHKCAGLGIKVERYFDSIPAAMAQEAENLGVPLIEVPIKFSLGNVMNEINSSKRLQKQESLLYINYFALFMQAADINEIAATLYTLLDNPVAIYNKDQELSYFIDTSNCLKSKFGFNLVQNPQTFALSFNEFTGNAPREIITKTAKINGSDIKYKVAPAFDGNQLLASIVVFEVNDITNVNLEIAVKVAVVSLILNIKKPQSGSASLGTCFLEQLLNGTLNPAYIKNGLAAANNFDERKKHLCVVVKFSSKFNGALYIGTRRIFEQTAAKYGKTCHFLKKENMLICFMDAGDLKQSYNTRKQFGPFIETLSSSLTAVCGDHFAIGIGEPVSDIALLKTSYTQAYKAIRYSGLVGKEPYNYFMDIKFYHLLEMINDRQQLEDFSDAYLHELVSHDKKYNTELLKTLEQYLVCNSNVAETAKQLYIHRNTMINRLSKIRELLDSELSDSNELLNCRIALIIKHILEMQRE